MLDPRFIKSFEEVAREQSINISKSQTGDINEALLSFESYQSKYKQNGMYGSKSLYPMIDKYISGFIQGKVYTIGAYSNTGKSRLAYSFAQDFIKKGKKVLFFSLEVDIGLLIGHIASAFYSKKLEDLENINPNDFNNIKLFDKIYRMDDIIHITEQEKPDIIFIDYIQAIQHKHGGEYERMTNIAIEIQQLAIRNNITIFSISQVNNESRFKEGDNVTLKGSGQIFASSDVIFILNKDSGLLSLTIVKNKFGYAGKKFMMNVNFPLSNFSLTEVSE